MKGLPKTKRCKSVAVTVSVRFRLGFSVYVKQPLQKPKSSIIHESLLMFFVFIVFAEEGDRLVDVYVNLLTCITDMYIIVSGYYI